MEAPNFTEVLNFSAEEARQACQFLESLFSLLDTYPKGNLPPSESIPLDALPPIDHETAQKLRQGVSLLGLHRRQADGYNEGETP